MKNLFKIFEISYHLLISKAILLGFFFRQREGLVAVLIVFEGDGFSNYI
jgi:hypothetical protein